MHIGTKSLDKIYFKNTELEVDAQDRIEVFGFDYGLFNHSKESQKVELYFGFIEIRKFVSQQDVQELKEVKVLNPNSEV